MNIFMHQNSEIPTNFIFHNCVEKRKFDKDELREISSLKVVSGQ